MFASIVKKQVRQGFAQISSGNFNSILNQMAADVHFSFAGEHAIGGEFHQKTTVKAWFERIHRLFPNLQITPKQIMVSGFPWDFCAITQFHIQATLSDGYAYQNDGVQILRIRFGKIIEDHLIEDTLILVEVLNHLAQLGIEEALFTPFQDGGV